MVQATLGRYDPIEPPTTCMIQIFRNNSWYQMRPLGVSIERSLRIIARLRRRGRIVKAIWLQGMGLGIG